MSGGALTKLNETIVDFQIFPFMLHWDIHATVKTCHHGIFCLGKTCCQKVYPRQKKPMVTFSQPYMITTCVYKQDSSILKLCMTRMINLSYYFVIIMCMIKNFTTLYPLFASVTACLTTTTFSFTSWGPHEAVSRLHESTCDGQVRGGHKICQKHFYPKAKDTT